MKEKMEEFHVEDSEEPENNESSFQISERPITFKKISPETPKKKQNDQIAQLINSTRKRSRA